MKRVEVLVVVVYHDFDYVAVGEDVGVCGAVDERRGGDVGGEGQCGVERGDLRREIGLVVERIARDAVYGGGVHVDDYLVVDGLEEGFVVGGGEGDVVDEVEFGCYWHGRDGRCVVVEQCGGHVRVVTHGWVFAFVEEHHVDVHGVEEGVVCGAVVFGFDKYRLPLPGCHARLLADGNLVGFRENAVDF